LSYFWLEFAKGCVGGSLRSNFKRRRGIRIFTYHGVVEKKKDLKLERNFHLLSSFREQTKFLSKLDVIRLDQVHEFLNSSHSSNRNACVITFDDGYANTVIAAEVLKQAHLPFSAFISTGTTGRGKTIWTVELSLLILAGSRIEIDLLQKKWPLTNREEREKSFEKIRTLMKAMPARERRQTMDVLRSQFPDGELQNLLADFPSFQMLNWDEIRQLTGDEVEIGSHGVFHEIHHYQQDVNTRLEELIQSKVELERQLNRSCRFFAFPNGNWTTGSADEVKKAGYELALTSERKTVRKDSNPYLLPRLESPGTLRGIVSEVFWNGTKKYS
jgi:peptidoglycan/xylan/chitin deacetylase (PgdA/CDA1 family)